MQPSCSNAKSPSTTVTGSQWTANLTGANNIEPNTTGWLVTEQGCDMLLTVNMQTKS